jgi:hypothetical protein
MALEDSTTIYSIKDSTVNAFVLFEEGEGYIAEKLPEKEIGLLPRKNGDFNFNVTQNGNKLNVFLRPTLKIEIY